MVKYKTKIAFEDAQSQLNTINYFDDFLNQHKKYIKSQTGGKYQIDKPETNEKPSRFKK